MVWPFAAWPSETASYRREAKVGQIGTGKTCLRLHEELRTPYRISSTCVVLRTLMLRSARILLYP